MSATVLLRHERRPIGATRPRAGRDMGAPEGSSPLGVRRLVRAEGEQGEGRPAPVPHRPAPMTVVGRLWAGVVSMFALILCFGLVGMTLGAWVLGYRPVVVTTASMAPAIRPGDVVITRKVGPDDALGAQTVIDFEDPDGSGHRLHRIVEVTSRGYRTKGDANPTTDSAVVPPGNVRGAGLVLAPFAGFLPLWVGQGQWVLVALAMAGLVAAASMSRRSWMWAGGSAL